MAVSTDANFINTSWQTYQSPYIYNTDHNTTLYVKFRSPDGGETNVYTVNIKANPTQINNQSQISEQIIPAQTNNSGTQISQQRSSILNQYTFTKFLTIGDTGEEVKQLQTKLKALGYFTYPSITGVYGSVTASAVSAFQKANGISAVGYVGPQTKAALNKQ